VLVENEAPLVAPPLLGGAVLAVLETAGADAPAVPEMGGADALVMAAPTVPGGVLEPDGADAILTVPPGNVAEPDGAWTIEDARHHGDARDGHDLQAQLAQVDGEMRASLQAEMAARADGEKLVTVAPEMRNDVHESKLPCEPVLESKPDHDPASCAPPPPLPAVSGTLPVETAAADILEVEEEGDTGGVTVNVAGNREALDAQVAALQEEVTRVDARAAPATAGAARARPAAGARARPPAGAAPGAARDGAAGRRRGGAGRRGGRAARAARRATRRAARRARGGGRLRRATSSARP
jgi:hypothetical protein